jgi:preprotein translocase subunit SecA
VNIGIITFNYFRLYNSWQGMTGTADTSLAISEITTDFDGDSAERVNRRTTSRPEFINYTRKSTKLRSRIFVSVTSAASAGGTTSIENSEIIDRLLSRKTFSSGPQRQTHARKPTSWHRPGAK